MENENLSSNEKIKTNEGLSPADLVKRHIQDHNDEITDEDFRNVKVGENGENEETVEKEVNKKEKELEDLPGKDDLHNPYSILGS